MRVYNSPEPKRIQNSDTFKISEANSRSIAPGHGYIKQSYLGNDLLQLSDDYSTPSSSNYNQGYYYNYSYNYNYKNFFKLFMIMLLIIILITISITTLVVLGGLISIIIFALVVLVSVFLYSINLNPFDKNTYKRIGSFLR
jgi:hypothetical protein